MSDSIIGANVVDYLFKTFSRDLQGRIVRYVYNTKVHVSPDVENDSVVITIRHKNLDISYEHHLANVSECIKDTANDDRVINNLARDIIKAYKDHVWHQLFYDFKKSRKNEDTEQLEKKPVKAIETIGEHVLKYHNDGYSNEQIAQMLDIDISTVIGALHLEFADNNASEEA